MKTTGGEYGKGDEQPWAVEPVEELPTDDVAGDDARQMAWKGASLRPQWCPYRRTVQAPKSDREMQRAACDTAHTPYTTQRCTHGLIHAEGQRSAPTKSTFLTKICVPMREPNGDSANGTDPYLSERKAAQIEAGAIKLVALGARGVCANHVVPTGTRQPRHRHDSKASACTSSGCVRMVRAYLAVRTKGRPFDRRAP